MTFGAGLIVLTGFGALLVALVLDGVTMALHLRIVNIAQLTRIGLLTGICQITSNTDSSGTRLKGDVTPAIAPTPATTGMTSPAISRAGIAIAVIWVVVRTRIARHETCPFLVERINI